jgi:hypothetical protein
MQRRTRNLTLASMLLIAAGLSGCVTSEASRYQRTMTSSVAPDRRVSAEVASAFGLRDGADATVSLGASDR